MHYQMKLLNFSLLLHARIRTPIFFFNATATTEIYTLSLHDALPILASQPMRKTTAMSKPHPIMLCLPTPSTAGTSRLKNRSEEHTSELQSRLHLVCRLLLEKKNKRAVRCTNIAH